MQFDQNNKVSLRQAYRLFTFDFLGASTLLLPTVLAKQTASNGGISIVLGTIVALLVVAYLYGIYKSLGVDGWEAIRLLPVGVQKLVGIWMSGMAIGMAAYALHLFIRVMQQFLIEEESFLVLLVTVVVLAGYGQRGGIENRARIFEILFWLVLIPLFLMLLLGIGEVQPQRLALAMPARGGWGDWIKGVGQGTYTVFLQFGVVFWFPYFRHYLAREKQGKRLFRAMCLSVFTVGLILLWVYQILLGSFGAKALMHTEFPVVTNMTGIQMIFGFLKRVDALMIAVWFFTLYALIGSCLFYGTNFMNVVKKSNWNRYSILVLTGALTVLMHYVEEVLHMYQRFMGRIGTPLMLLLPLVIALLLTGCRSKELENRFFPMAIGISAQGDIVINQEEKAKYQGKEADYNHLKVVILDEVYVKEKNYDRLLQLSLVGDIPRNAYVAVANQADMDKLLGMGEKTSDVLEACESEKNDSVIADLSKNSRLVTWGALIDEQFNQNQQLTPPVLHMLGEVIQVE